MPAFRQSKPFALFRADRVPVDPLLTHRLKLEEINEGFDRLREGLGCGKSSFSNRASVPAGDSLGPPQFPGSTMKQNSVNAGVMTAPGKFEVRCYPYPDIDEVSMVIELEMCGICGTDMHTFRGETVQYAGTPAESHTPFPIIPGHKIVGKVAEIGGTARHSLELPGRSSRSATGSSCVPTFSAASAGIAGIRSAFRFARTSKATARPSPATKARI
jgi:Alcohol dehydrogenase GroES-like domain